VVIAKPSKGPVSLLFLVALLDLIGFGIVIPILPFMSPAFGATQFDIALIIVVYAIASGIMAPFWGRLSDRIGRKKTLMICLIGAVASYIGLAFASTLWMIYLARAFAGLMAGNLPVAAAMMADLTSVEHRASAMGKLGAAFGLGLVIGPLLGGLLSGDSGSFLLPCLTAAAMSLIACLAAGVFLQETVSKEDQILEQAAPRVAFWGSNIAFVRRTKTLNLVTQFGVHSAIVSSTTYLLPIWTAERLAYSPKQVGIVLGIQGFIMAMIQGGLIGKLIDWFGELRLMRWALVSLALGLAIAIFADSEYWIPLSFFIAMTGANVCFPVLNALASKRVDVQDRGKMMGATGSASSWGRVLGPLTSGLAVMYFGYSVAWFVLLLLSLYYMYWAYYVADVRSFN